ncbi:MAG: SLBB domain-containing protein [Deltaproteobacteria bacterium]|nr:SLBB domain-containing protein [Deltaproteobacteria bacterium]
MRKIFYLFLLFVIGFFPVQLLAQNYGQSMGSQQKNTSSFRKQSGGGAFGQSGLDKEAAIKAAGNMGTAPMSSGQGQMGGLDYQIHILGQVANPGTFRLPASTRLDEAIKNAGGIKERGSLRRVEVRRDGHTTFYDLLAFQKNGELNQNPYLMDNDVVFVSYAENTVLIEGPVKSSGTYELSNNRSVWSVIELAGGFTAGVTNNDPVVVVRFVDGKREVIKIVNSKPELESFELVNGDIVVVPHLLVENRHFDYNISELPNDNIFYPTQKNEIFVTGAVSQPGPFPFNPGYSTRDFINISGPTELSNLSGVYILTSDGKHIRNPEKKKDFHLSPGDSIVVPRRHLTTDNVLKWYNTFTGTVFTSFALKQLLN